MTFLGKIKNAFGFSDSEYENEQNAAETGRDATVVPLSERRRQAESASKERKENTPKPQPSPVRVEEPELPNTAPEQIFTRVVEIFNESLPAFLKESVDREAQCRYIHQALDESMQQYIANLAEASERRTAARWANERSDMMRSMADLREKSKRSEDSSAEWKEQKLSAERQKRALSERVHDLEKQIDALLAEREQFELENKSLINKLRVVEVQGKDVEALQADNNELRKELLALRNGSPECVATGDEPEQVAKLQAENDSLKAEVEQLNSDIDTLKKRCEMADTMINDLNNKNKAVAHDRNENKTALDDANEKLRQNVEELEARTEELRVAKEEVEQARASLSEFEEVLTRFEELKQAKDKKIADLQEQLTASQSNADAEALAAAREKLVDAEAEIASLKSTIENNLRMQAESEAALRAEIENMRSASERQRRPRRKDTSHVEIDDNLNDTNWLVSTPPPGTNARLSNLTDEEFGYHEPKHSTPPSDDSMQMLLW